MDAYVVSEIETCINKFNELGNYWNRNTFMGNDEFNRGISFRLLERIRRTLRFYPYYGYSVATADSLWNPPYLLQYFLKNSTKKTVRTAVSSLDKKTLRFKTNPSVK